MLRILIADDHEVTRRGLREILKDEFGEVDVEEAADAAATLARVEAGKWDLLMLDIVMPGMNVIDMLAAVRRVRSRLPVLILTAIPEMEYVVRTLKAGANGYINKQRAADELIVAVRKVLAGETYLSSDAIGILTDTLRGDGAVHPHHEL